MVEMEVIVVTKEENVMPENWRPASEMRALVESYENKSTQRAMGTLMERIKNDAICGLTEARVCLDRSWCNSNVSKMVTDILKQLGYEVTVGSYGNDPYFIIHW